MYQLTFPAPRRCSVELPYGKYECRKWKASDVLAYRKAGGRFHPLGQHEFETKAVASLAYGGIEGLTDIQLKTIAKQLEKLEG